MVFTFETLFFLILLIILKENHQLHFLAREIETWQRLSNFLTIIQVISLAKI